ncbi:hypothetical protein BDV95DRAFT_607481 [Massariosphaeria phaeospora]|uniref:Uncharacterized protein n=1 Tax=Massariosphaeria phaeospora TaxID=100035 RepID=A0A7C8M9Q1_9PLEO|nr:hypothetical protein BDV95DRAFT_607481 [Massariosphaeria phaeospora]
MPVLRKRKRAPASEPVVKLSPIQVTAHPTPRASRVLYNTVNEIALQYTLSHHWSSFHTWEYIQKHKLDRHTVEESLCSALSPHGTCLTVSILVAKALRAAIAKTTSISQYAKHVKLLTSTAQFTPRTRFHAVVALCFDTYALVIDHAKHPTAFAVPLNGCYDTLEFVRLLGDTDQTRWHYSSAWTCEGPVFTLRSDDMYSEKATLTYGELDSTAALRQLTIPSHSELRRGPNGTQLPPRQYFMLNKPLAHKPKHLPSVSTPLGHVAEVCFVQVSFHERTMMVMIPYEDWLVKAENRGWSEALEGRRMVWRVDERIALLRIPLDGVFERGVLRDREGDLRLAGRIAEALGVPRGVVVHMAKAAIRTVERARRTAEKIAAGGPSL